LVRKTNQDSGYVSSTALFVADGMGGAAGGDLASALVIRDLCSVGSTSATGPEALDVLRRAVTRANADLARLVAKNPDLDGMGTTICGGIFDGHTMNVVHIGDSRGYILAEQTMRRITHDHSYVQSLIDEGRLDERQAMNHPHRSLLLRVLNGQVEANPDYLTCDVEAGNRLMFCSDGLSGLVDDVVIAAALNLPDPKEAMDTLVKLAYAAGGSDNITILIADVVAEEDETSDQDQPTPAAEEQAVVETTEPHQIVVETTEPTQTVVETTEPHQTVAETTEPTQTDDDNTAVLSVESTVQDVLLSPTYTTSGLLGAAADPAIISLLERLKPSAKDEPAADLPEDETTTLTPARHRRLKDDQETRRYSPSKRRPRAGILLIVLAILVVLGGAGWGVYAYMSSQYYVGADQGYVAIYQGLPGTVAGFSTSHVFEKTDILLSDLPISWSDNVTGTMRGSDGRLSQARATVTELQSKSAQCLASRAQRPPDASPSPDGC